MSVSAARRDIPSLTAIRGVAAVAVVVHHQTLFFRFNEWTHPFTLISTLFMGYTGVDLFFVLSGFILTKIYLTLQPRGWGRFFLRRLLRLYPLHLSILAFMALGSLCSIGLAPHKLDWHMLAWSASLLGPFVGLGPKLWNNVSWSISVELVCYIGFPVGVMLLRGAPNWLLGLALAGIAALTWYVHLIHPESWVGLGALQRGGSDFALGAVTGLLATRVTPSKSLAWGLELLGAGLILWGMLSMQPPFIPLGAATLIFALNAQKGPLNALLTFRPLVYLGDISFSLYLLQFVVFFGLFAYWPLAHYPQQLYPAWAPAFILHELGYFAVLILLSSLTYRWIEQPCRALGHRRAQPPRPTVPAGG